ncbi:MAG: VWA domain-containing protein, partial [Oscillospiraceae bacterium]|nr:VWA domain-containing protein [Oscillospiraceae bacterium]
VNFPSPTILVDCGIIVIPEECPEPVEVSVDGCTDTIEFDAGELGLESLGRIVQLDVTLTNVCPGRRVALAVILNELDDEDLEYKRGMKILTIPAHEFDSCRDITIRCVKFVLPEDLSQAEDTTSICGERRFRARFVAHYIDNDFACCDEELQ